MKTIHIGSPQDCLALVVRRKWWIIVPFFALSSVISLLTFLLPRTYESTALVVIRPRDVPKDLVYSLVSGTTEERLNGIKQTVLSKTNLSAVLREFEDRLVDYRPLNIEQRVDKLRARIAVTFDGSRSEAGRDGVTYFRVAFQHGDPKLAQDITEKVTSLFVDQDKVVREGMVSGTTAFLAESLQKAEEELRLSDAKLKKLKESRRFELPDQLATNLNVLDRLSTDRRSNRESLDRYNTQRMNLEQLLAETKPTVTETVRIRRTPKPKPPRKVNPLVEEYRVKERQYEALRARYTDSYREVVLAKAELDQLKSRIPAEDFNPQPDPVVDEEADTEEQTKPNPVYTSLVARLKELQTEMQIREEERKSIESDIEKYGQRVTNTPRTDIELSDILRENTDLNKQYQDLKAKLTSARLSESLENGKQGSQFDVIDPANYPLAPFKPVRSLILLGGLAISFAVGVGCAVVVDTLDQRYWTQPELEAALGVTVLAEIPSIVTDTDTRSARTRRIAMAASMATGALVYGCGLYAVYLKQATVIRGLEPFIQKLVY